VAMSRRESALRASGPRSFAVTDASPANEDESRARCVVEGGPRADSATRLGHVFEDGSAIKPSRFTRCPEHPASQMDCNFFESFITREIDSLIDYATVQGGYL